jgi:hypothetical protein
LRLIQLKFSDRYVSSRDVSGQHEISFLLGSNWATQVAEDAASQQANGLSIHKNENVRFPVEFLPRPPKAICLR